MHHIIFFQGMPTHDKAGEKMSGKQVKKLAKSYQAQEKLYNEYLKSTGANNEGATANGDGGAAAKS